MKSMFKPYIFVFTIISLVSFAVTFIMDGFKAGLGVKCIFYIPLKTDPKKLDFAADDKNHKIIAREMMLMTAKMNKKYFKEFQEKKGVAALKCGTRHKSKLESKLDIFLKKKG